MKSTLLILTIFINLIYSLQVFALEEIKLVIVADVYNDYKKFLGNRDPLAITDFSGPGTRRDVVEPILLQQALNHKGIKYKIVFDVAPNYKRLIQSIRLGRAFMGSNTVWAVDIDKKDSFISSPLIKQGEFEAGFYTMPTNKRALSTKNIEELLSLSAISSEAWTADWLALKKLNFKELHNTSTWESMVKMVRAGRGDFLLAPFQATSDMSLRVDDIILVPIPNFKIKLNGERVLSISKKYKNSEKVLEELNTGIKHLRENKILYKAYTQSGFTNQKVSNWYSVN